jgi:hypothetical protein
MKSFQTAGCSATKEELKRRVQENDVVLPSCKFFGVVVASEGFSQFVRYICAGTVWLRSISLFYI